MEGTRLAAGCAELSLDKPWRFLMLVAAEAEPAVPPIGRTNWKMRNHPTFATTLPPAKPAAIVTSASSPKISPKKIVVSRCKTRSYPPPPPFSAFRLRVFKPHQGPEDRFAAAWRAISVPSGQRSVRLYCHRGVCLGAAMGAPVCAVARCGPSPDKINLELRRSPFTLL